MSKYENMTFEEIKKMPLDEFYKLPKHILDNAIKEHSKIPKDPKRILIDDSFIIID